MDSYSYSHALDSGPRSVRLPPRHLARAFPRVAAHAVLARQDSVRIVGRTSPYFASPQQSQSHSKPPTGMKRKINFRPFVLPLCRSVGGTHRHRRHRNPQALAGAPARAPRHRPARVDIDDAAFVPEVGSPQRDPDADLWDAVRQVHLAALVGPLLRSGERFVVSSLDMDVVNGEKNMSAGNFNYPLFLWTLANSFLFVRRAPACCARASAAEASVLLDHGSRRVHRQFR